MRRSNGKFHKKVPSRAQMLYLRRRSQHRHLLRMEPWNYVHTDRLRAVVRDWTERFNAEHEYSQTAWGANKGYGAMGYLAARMGVSHRKVYRHLTERPSYSVKRSPRYRGHPDGYLFHNGGADVATSVYLLDQFLVAMDQLELLHLPAEQGGFADVWMHEGLPVLEDEPELLAA